MGIFGNAFNGWHLLIILAVVLLLFGAPKLPGLAKSIGQSMRIFRNEVKSMKDEDAKPTENAAPAADVTPEHPASTETQPKP
ncbi:MAG: sec-independent protein translocase protein TatA [Microbacteriaceae bacterium]|jgi:sec-independent protein translocase protein TatA|nr:sec-independent protein translocase protein TatA [Microbacteriaceae bacterium]